MKNTKDGLEILLKYCSDAKAIMRANFEVIYCGPDSIGSINEEDLERLKELGFNFSVTDRCFYKIMRR